MCSEQDDVHPACGREHVLVVLVLVACQLRTRDDERRCARELFELTRLASGGEPLEALRTEHAKAPRLRDVVVRGPAGQLEQLRHELARDRLLTEAFVRAARADPVLELHEPATLDHSGRMNRLWMLRSSSSPTTACG